jgi:hypothetical protein
MPRRGKIAAAISPAREAVSHLDAVRITGAIDA